MSAVAERHGATPAQVRIAWTLAQGAHVLAIPGTGNVTHWRRTWRPRTPRLTTEDLSHLDATLLWPGSTDPRRRLRHQTGAMARRLARG